jgi:hypothetical protein
MQLRDQKGGNFYPGQGLLGADPGVAQEVTLRRELEEELCAAPTGAPLGQRYARIHGGGNPQLAARYPLRCPSDPAYASKDGVLTLDY